MSLFEGLLIASGISIILLVFFWSRYNLFVALINQVAEDFSDIDIQLKRRVDLIGRLVEVTKGYAKHEKEVFENVARLRAYNHDKPSIKEIEAEENHIAKTYHQILAVAEKYPDLKANETFRELMNNMTETENNVAEYRETYNQTVKRYNNSIQVFPNVIAAHIFGFTRTEFFSMKEDI